MPGGAPTETRFSESGLISLVKQVTSDQRLPYDTLPLWKRALHILRSFPTIGEELFEHDPSKEYPQPCVYGISKDDLNLLAQLRYAVYEYDTPLALRHITTLIEGASAWNEKAAAAGVAISSFEQEIVKIEEKRSRIAEKLQTLRREMPEFVDT